MQVEKPMMDIEGKPTKDVRKVADKSTNTTACTFMSAGRIAVLVVMVGGISFAAGFALKGFVSQITEKISAILKNNAPT